MQNSKYCRSKLSVSEEQQFEFILGMQGQFTIKQSFKILCYASKLSVKMNIVMNINNSILR